MAAAAAAKKWPRSLYVAAVLPADQAQVGLVHQGRGLERLAGLLPRQLPGGQLAQLVVDQGQELLGRLGVALLDGREDAGDVVHRRWPPGTGVPQVAAHPRARRPDRPRGPDSRDMVHPSDTPSLACMRGDSSTRRG